MGYYTRFTLTQERNPISVETLSEEISSRLGMNYALQSDGSPSDSTKWYEHDEDMLKLSAKYPKTVFKLYGEGENNGDIWAKFYHDGKMKHEIRLESTLPEPDLDAIAPVEDYEPEFDPSKGMENAGELFLLLERAIGFIRVSQEYTTEGSTGARSIVTEGIKLLKDCRS
jgi:hypothetical protein